MNIDWWSVTIETPQIKKIYFERSITGIFVFHGFNLFFRLFARRDDSPGKASFCRLFGHRVV